jgi:malonyl CoA-acyl carrier protein transacylase
MCKPGPGLGVTQIVLGRASVGEDGKIPKYPAAYMKLDLGIVPGAQQSTESFNWLQDEIIAMTNKSRPEAHVDAKLIGVPYHRKLFRGRYVYMAHAKNAVVQELVASTLKKYKIPMVPWVIYNAAKEVEVVAGMESELKAFNETMAKAVGAELSSGDRRSLARRFWDAHKDILKSIAGEEFMAENNPTDWAAASAEQHKLRQGDHTAVKNKYACKSGRP